MGETKITVALAGNPNSGKTTIFNNITGAKQHVGNYPGVTVEKREGSTRYNNRNLLLVDLPGTYSLTAHSPDELAARNFIVQERPDVIIDVLDAGNLERNLYFAVQLLELDRPLVLALNMADVAENMGTIINEQVLEQQLGVAVVRTIGNRNKGLNELLHAAVEVAGQKQPKTFMVDYGPDIESSIARISAVLADVRHGLRFPQRWLALKLLENDQDIDANIQRMPGGERILAIAAATRQDLQIKLGDDPELVIASLRYRFVGKLCEELITAKREGVLTPSDKIDRILTNRIFGLPIFLGMMWLMFNLVFTFGAYPQEWIENGMSLFGTYVSQHLAEGDLKSLLVDGIIGGVGGVIGFLPHILLLFLCIALLEDTGYMARAAFVMDRIMRAVGLHGKSFIPLLLGFGCSVPAVMGTRTLENPRDRLVTILVTPLMSCSARLPVYTVLIGAFFSEAIAGTVLFSIYILGIILAILMARIFRSLLFPGTSEPFVMELPPYRFPTLQTIVLHMWERSVLYLRKAGTIILAVSILVWFLVNYPSDVNYSKDYVKAKAQVEENFNFQVKQDILTPLGIAQVTDNAALKTVISRMPQNGRDNEDIDSSTSATSKGATLTAIQQDVPAVYPLVLRYLELYQQRNTDREHLQLEQAGEKLANSYAGRFGHMLEPVISPLGFDWKIGVGLFSAVAAKEVLVSTLGTIYSASESDENPLALQEALAASPTFTPLVAYNLMVFTLIYSPCLPAVAVIKRETNSWKWALFSPIYSTILAWVVAFIVYQVGSLLGY